MYFNTSGDLLHLDLVEGEQGPERGLAQEPKIKTPSQHMVRQKMQLIIYSHHDV